MGGIDHLHPGQLGHHTLVFKDGLQGTLASLRLVGGVGGVELPPHLQLGHHAGRKMVVRPRPQKPGVVVGVGIFIGQPSQLGQNFHLGEGPG